MTAVSVINRVPRPVWWTGGTLATLIAAVLLFLAFANWNMLRGPIAREASSLTGRTITIGGDLEVHPWSWTPRVVVNGLKIGNPRWADGGLLADIPKLTVEVRLWPLLTGHWNLKLLDMERPTLWLFQDGAGRANWRSDTTNAKPTRLPPIERFIVDNGKLGFFSAPRQLTISGTIQSHEYAKASGGSFVLLGGGSLDARPFRLDVIGAPLLNLKANQPYPFDAHVQAGDTRVIARGALAKPFDFGQLKAALTVSGRDFADLYQLTGLALPNTPPYRLTGDLVRDGQSYRFSHVHGRVGSSDMSGEFRVDRVKDRRTLQADLHSHSLNIYDLGSLVGAPPRGERTPLEAAQAAKRQAEGRLLPDATLNVSRVRSTDAVLHYTADQVTAQSNLPLKQVVLDLKLDHGVLTMTPLAFSLPRGAVTARIRIDARTDTPKDDVDIRVTNAHLEDFFKNTANAPLEGALEARAELHGVGDSVHKAASTANGTLALAVPKGAVRKVLAEALGIDATKALGLFLAKDQTETNVRCALADFSSSNGVLTARNIVLDSDPVLAKGQGTVDLRSETLNLTLEGRPKSFRLIRVMAPITLTGQIKSPHIGVKAGKAPEQAIAAVALGAVLTPFAAVLPFIDPGLAKNADCSSLLVEAQQKGAPVKASAIAAAKPARK